MSTSKKRTSPISPTLSFDVLYKRAHTSSGSGYGEGGGGGGGGGHLPTPPLQDGAASSAAAVSPGDAFERDFMECKSRWGGKEGGYVHDDASGEAFIKRLRSGDTDTSLTCMASFFDEEEVHRTLGININVDLESYPSAYSIYLYTEDDSAPHHISEALEYFPQQIRLLTLPQLVRRLLRSLQGEAMSDAATLEEDNEEAAARSDGDGEAEWADWGGGAMGGVKENDSGFKGVRADKKLDFDILRRDFKEIFEAGFRPGFYRISDDEIIISVSALFRDLNVPAEALERWDKRLYEAHPTSRLILLMNIGSHYPPKKNGHEWSRVPSKPSFWVGLGDEYKPSLETIKKTCWKFSGQPLASLASFLATQDTPKRPSDFQPFLLSSPLASLLNEQFLVLLNSRTKNPKLGWPAVEKLISSRAEAGDAVAGSSVLSAKEEKVFKKADSEEKALKRPLPKDSWKCGKDNYCLLAFEYLLRRFTLSTRFCLNCYNPVKVESLRPYVCSADLCVYAYQGLGLGPPVEYEIRENPSVVDMLVSFAYVVCREGNENSLAASSYPNGLHIELPVQLVSCSNRPTAHKNKPEGTTILFDDLESIVAKREALAGLIDRIPRISDLREGLLKGKTLKDLHPEIHRGVWGALRWIVASNTSYLKECSYDERITSISDVDYRQFQFVVGNPEKEVEFKKEKESATLRHAHTKAYPSILAFHGSPARNWHNILRVGLTCDYVGNARAYGHGIYFAVDGTVSMGHYAQATGAQRANSDFLISSCSALVEIVNARSEFVSSSPYLVVKEPSWCQPRYLIVKGRENGCEDDPEPALRPPVRQPCMSSKASRDPTYHLKIASQEVLIAENEARYRLIEPRLCDDDWWTEDRTILFGVDEDVAMGAVDELDDDFPTFLFTPSSTERIQKCHLLPAPEGSTTAIRSLGNAFKALVAEQSSKNASNVYINPEHEDLFSWIIELHSFPTDSQVHKDLLRHNLPSILTEIRFPSDFPFSPPFVRVLHPRFLPFANGGGGHITAGGSICSELLTLTGWNPTYTISAVLTELAANMTIEREAKIDSQDWDRPYTSQESAQAYKRVAQQHGWTVPPNFDKLFLTQ